MLFLLQNTFNRKVKYLQTFNHQKEKKTNMLSVRCTVTLIQDTKRKVEIELRKDKDGKMEWYPIKSSGGSLALSAPKGTWETNYGDVLSLWEFNSKRKVQNLVMLVVFDIKQDFLKTLSTTAKPSRRKMPAYTMIIRRKKMLRSN